MQEPTAGKPEFRPLAELEFEPTTCPVCGASEVRKPLEKEFQGLTLHFATCVGCSTLYQNPRMTVDSLRTMYDSEEFFEGGEQNVNYYSFLSGETYLRRTAKGRIERFRPEVQRDQAAGGGLGGRVLPGRSQGRGFRRRGRRVLQPDGGATPGTGGRSRSRPARSRRSS